MTERHDPRPDRSSSLLWTLSVPIGTIDESNAEAVVEWLKDRSETLGRFTTIVTGSLVLLTVFGKKPGFRDFNEFILSLSLSLILISLICSIICIWQIPNWKYAIRVGEIKTGKKMVIDLVITSWIGLIAFLAALVMAAIGNSV
jgi:hypothetical protein